MKDRKHHTLCDCKCRQSQRKFLSPFFLLKSLRRQGFYTIEINGTFCIMDLIFLLKILLKRKTKYEIEP